MAVATLDVKEIIADAKPGQTSVLYGVRWEDYLQIVNDTFEQKGYRISYNRGVLKTITGQSLKRENISRFIEKIITLIGLKLGISIVSAGSMTLTSSKLRKGAEPGQSYYIQNANQAKITDKLFDDSTGVPPDLVVEIDRGHSSDDKFEIYAAFGIREFWLCMQDRLRIFNLAETGEYLEAERSVALPILTAEVLTEFINRALTEDQFKVLNDFQNWLAENSINQE